MKREQQESARLQYALEFREGADDLLARNVNEGIEGRDASQCLVRKIESEHRPLPEGNARVQPPRLFDHALREVEAANIHSTFVEKAGDLPRPTADIARPALAANPRGETVQHLAVQRLAGELTEEAPRVLRRQPVIALL